MPKTYTLKLSEQEHAFFRTMVDALLKSTGAQFVVPLAHAHLLLHTCEVTETPEPAVDKIAEFPATDRKGKRR